ncbi:MAG: hypothetical protein OEV28_07355 [Nitrospirota bacterium]|nr:hypothetical protein [Nitrospirota bacterium]
MHRGGRADLSEKLPLFTCRVGNTWFAVPAVEVEKVVSSAEGLTVAAFPGIAVKPGEGGSYMVSNCGGSRVGYHIDEVGRIDAFPANSFYHLPDYLKEQCHRAVWGIGLVGGCAYFLIDLADIDTETI